MQDAEQERRYDWDFGDLEALDAVEILGEGEASHQISCDAFSQGSYEGER